MYHVIEFATDLLIDVETRSQSRLERVLVRTGDRRSVQLKPHVMESVRGPVEVADLYFDDGSATRDVRFAFFRFVEGE